MVMQANLSPFNIWAAHVCCAVISNICKYKHIAMVVTVSSYDNETGKVPRDVVRCFQMLTDIRQPKAC